jgi:nucleotide-binding universal stress UspA family protein
MESRSRGAVTEMALGSVSEAVVRRSPVPVLLVGPHVENRPAAYTTLVVAVDGSAPSEVAVDAAAALAPRLGADLFLAQVLDPADGAPPPDVLETNYLRRVASRLPSSRTDYDVFHARHAARAIVDLARDRPDALVVIGTHGRSGVRRLAMGSVALDVVRHSPSPVLVVSSASATADAPSTG